jgi:hypothetical protein
MTPLLLVIPAQAGTQGHSIERLPWAPAFAGVTTILIARQRSA